MKRRVNLLPVVLLCLTLSSAAQPPAATNTSGFERSAPAALQAMRQKAETLKTGGVALLALFDGSPITAWTSKMLVVGHMKDAPTETQKGNNLLAIVYTKAAEMADTLKDSGSGVRPPMTGEFGWQGGVIVPAGSGYLIAAFSGGKSEDDVAISRAGVEAMREALHLPATAHP